MRDGKVKQAESKKCRSSYVFEAFKDFVDRHLVEGHDVRMFLDPNGNSYSILCVTCDPRLTDVVTTRH